MINGGGGAHHALESVLSTIIDKGTTMLQIALTWAIGLAGGVLVGLQSPISGTMAARLGGASSSLIIHLVGLILSVVLVVARGGENLGAWRTMPPYMLLSGVVGVFLIITLGYTVPRLGAGGAITLIIVGQLMAGVLIDQFGLFGAPVRPLDVSRAIAVVLLLIGGYLMVR